MSRRTLLAVQRGGVAAGFAFGLPLLLAPGFFNLEKGLKS
jgi:hypothetical protein